MTIISTMGIAPCGFYKVLSHSFSFDLTAIRANIIGSLLYIRCFAKHFTNVPYIILKMTLCGNTQIIPILLIRKLWLREIKPLT